MLLYLYVICKLKRRNCPLMFDFHTTFHINTWNLILSFFPSFLLLVFSMAFPYNCWVPSYHPHPHNITIGCRSQFESFLLIKYEKLFQQWKQEQQHHISPSNNPFHFPCRPPSPHFNDVKLLFKKEKNQ